MESYRTVRALAAIKTYMEEGKNQEAYDLVQKLNPKKVRSVQDLNMMDIQFLHSLLLLFRCPFTLG